MMLILEGEQSNVKLLVKRHIIIRQQAMRKFLLVAVMILTMVHDTADARTWRPKGKPAAIGDFVDLKGDEVHVQTKSGIVVFHYLELSRQDMAVVKGSMKSRGRTEDAKRLIALESGKAQPATPGQPAETPSPVTAETAAESRIWRDVNGNQITGEFAGLRGAEVQIRSNGTVQSFPMSVLSQADQQWVAQKRQAGMSDANESSPAAGGNNAAQNNVPGGQGMMPPTGGYPGLASTGYPGMATPGYPGPGTSNYSGAAIPPSNSSTPSSSIPGQYSGGSGQYPAAAAPGMNMPSGSGQANSGYSGQYPGGAGQYPGMSGQYSGGPGQYPGAAPGMNMPSGPSQSGSANSGQYSGSATPSGSTSGSGPGSTNYPGMNAASSSSYPGAASSPGSTGYPGAGGPGAMNTGPSFPGASASSYQPPRYEPPAPPEIPSLPEFRGFSRFNDILKCEDCGAEFTEADGLKEGDSCPKCNGGSEASSTGGTRTRYRGLFKGIAAIVALAVSGVGWIIKRSAAS